MSLVEEFVQFVVEQHPDRKIRSHHTWGSCAMGDFARERIPLLRRSRVEHTAYSLSQKLMNESEHGRRLHQYLLRGDFLTYKGLRLWLLDNHYI